jgi:hypothetical protein
MLASALRISTLAPASVREEPLEAPLLALERGRALLRVRTA